MLRAGNVRLLYAIRFFQHLIPAYVIERLYWEQRGMTIQMVVYAEMIFAATIVLSELPTGIIADKWGRKRLIVVTALMGCLEFLILVFATEFWHFALVVFLAAIGNAAASGAETALLYDTLLAERREREFEKILGRLNALDIAATILAALSGSLLAGHFGFEFNYWLSLGAMAVSLFLTAALAEPVQESRKRERPIPIGEYVTTSLRFFRSHPGVALVLLSGMTMGAAVNYVDEFWQTHLDRLGIPVVLFGVFSAAIFLLRLPGSLFAYKLLKRFGTRPMLLTILGAMTVSFAWLAWSRDYGGLAALFLVSLFAGMIEPIASGYLQHRIGSDMRATMGSFQSLGENAVLMLSGLGFGYYSSQYDIFGGFGFIAAMCGAFLLFFAFSSRNLIEREAFG